MRVIEELELPLEQRVRERPLGLQARQCGERLGTREHLLELRLEAARFLGVLGLTRGLAQPRLSLQRNSTGRLSAT
jgi:hypothetical protein